EILLTNTTTIDSLFGLGEQWILSLKTNTDFTRKTTGEILLTNTTTIDSLFGLGEQWILSLKTNTDFTRTHYSRAYTASVNIPYGYWFYQYQVSHSQSSYPFQSHNAQYRYKKQKIVINTFDISRFSLS
ncbi:ShlB/FhaC/HecB family hemolysin secretion/activation protein, partial [Shigella sp. FC1967]|uniref:ShlB/FhaC/HecB family hemolysin secretion/activation protein n=1 Tax=Shigella sp. FC1967 TaxID=1898041 RepID=UPI000A665027